MIINGIEYKLEDDESNFYVDSKYITKTYKGHNWQMATFKHGGYSRFAMRCSVCGHCIFENSGRFGAITIRDEVIVMEYYFHNCESSPLYPGINKTMSIPTCEEARMLGALE